MIVIYLFSIYQMLHLVTCGGSTATSAEAADDCPKRAVNSNVRPEEESVLSLPSGESRCRGRRSAVGATEEEASAFVGARFRGERSETSLGYG